MATLQILHVVAAHAVATNDVQLYLVNEVDREAALRIVREHYAPDGWTVEYVGPANLPDEGDAELIYFA